MILIADSGSTKTTWTRTGGSQPAVTLTTGGLNPYFHTRDSVKEVIREGLTEWKKDAGIEEIHFYGAGCSTVDNNRMISDALKEFFGNPEVFVYHDILGAARALFGRGSGIACILGTGCNSCYYDGDQTFEVVDSLGYLFGDEGAGSYLGKLFLGAYLRKELPADLRNDFDHQYALSLETILNSLYNKPSPNRFLASFSHFLAPRKEHPYVHALLKRSFRDFFEAHIRKYQGYPSAEVGFIGSIAHIYRDVLEEVAREEHTRITRILPSPLDGLVAFHSA
ncbi:MAG TPA: ATPase [Bacteroidales bacterium]|nr:ATPase [Bacteroidales bacterium]HPS61504.1 ATPase [Bacteroidales bacterium]